MSCCRRSRVVDVEVAGQGDVAVVDGVVVVDDEAAQSWRRKKMRYDGAADVDDTSCRCQRVSSAMSPPILPRPEEAHRTHIGFARTVWLCRVVTVVTPCQCSRVVVDDAVDAVVVTRSLPSSWSRLAEKICQRTLVVHLVDEAAVVCRR